MSIKTFKIFESESEKKLYTNMSFPSFNAICLKRGITMKDISKISNYIITLLPEEIIKNLEIKLVEQVNPQNNKMTIHRMVILNKNKDTILINIWACTDEYFFVRYESTPRINWIRVNPLWPKEYMVDGYDGLEQLFHDTLIT